MSSEPLDTDALRSRYPMPWGGNEVFYAMCPNSTLHAALDEIDRLREELQDVLSWYCQSRCWDDKEDHEARWALLPPDMRP